ncbi:conjugative relaxase-like TrwC/TraI family protein [Nocardia tenerifensis]|uniref:Conjugative relaxase-like TrwC/TraI family protein n=2 Tax=Nocardia tenerifensis TaxID=228006 RepID=A0A318JS68_9NOCA|nr:MobF family relaxase [Nocardia tenerifensis]PXX53434.1 conjugative relaxase-like TrwC/TraI family protein [Nocardia tenerifensis]
MMTIHPLHAGEGYLYLTQQVASGDRMRDRTRDLTDYYLETGTPPGIWLGKGAALLGVSGEVTESQMAALFGEGLHPEADAIIAREIVAGKTAKQAIDAAKLGSAYYEFSTKSSPINTIFDRMLDQFTSEEKRRPSWDERTVLRCEAARAHLTTTLGRPPVQCEIESALAAERANSRRAVAGFDLVFTPPKSISILWGLGDDEVRATVWRCHNAAVLDALQWAESRCAVTRRGHNGVRQIDAEGFTIAAFTHFDNRSGDMNLHTHPVVSNRVLGSDGKWTSLDARPLFASAVACSSRYNATIIAMIRRELGARFEERSRGRGKQPVLEVVGISDRMIKEFSRTPDIIARTEQLVAGYRAAHGRNPGTITQYRLAAQATLQTRNAKPLPKRLRDMITEWDGRSRRLLHDGRASVQFIRDVLHPNSPPAFDSTSSAIAIGVELGGAAALLRTPPDEIALRIRGHLDTYTFDTPAAATRAGKAVRNLLISGPDLALLERIDDASAAQQRTIWEPERIVDDVVDTIARRRATWTESNIYSAVDDRLANIAFPSHSAHRAAVEQIVAVVRDRRSIQLTIEPDELPASLARRSGESELTVTGATRYTSQAVLDAETRLLDAAKTPTADVIPSELVDKAIASLTKSEGLTLNSGQRVIAEHLCGCGLKLAAAVGPAGAGKTTAMKAVAAAWRAAGRTVIPLAPSASAARVLGNDLGIRARTIHTLITQTALGLPTGLSPGSMLLIDEAAMAATAALDAVLEIAHKNGAIIRCIGDPEQLSAVESGGIFRTIAHDARAPELTQVVRFHDPAEAEATLAVRAGNIDDAWDFYANHGRVISGMSDELRETILTRYLTDTTAGVDSVMLAATIADVGALNAGAQAAHVLTGRVKPAAGRILLSDGHTGYVGDIVLTRRNNRLLRVHGGIRHGTQVDNGDLWLIRKIHSDNSITVLGTNHRGSLRLSAHYIREHVELGYASTIHRAQGITVRRAYLLLNETLGRALAYVGLTRAWQFNILAVATDTLVDPTRDQQPDEPIKPREAFGRVLARDDDNLSATDVMREEQKAADHRIRITYHRARQLLADGHGRYLLERALPVALFHATTKSEQFQKLLDTIDLANTHRLDSRQLVAAVATNDGEDLGESLATASDTAALLRSRADRWIRDHLPITPPANTIEPVEILTDLDHSAAAKISAQLNATEVHAHLNLTFHALEDASAATSIQPLPPPHPGMDSELANYATEIRRRLTTPTAEELLPPENPDSIGILDLDDNADAEETHSAEDATAYPDAIRRDRIDRMTDDYNRYIKELADQRSEQLLYRALPVVIYHHIRKLWRYQTLLDTIALADAHHLDTTVLVATIATNNYTDDGESLLQLRDPAGELRDRADNWISHNIQGMHHETPHQFRALTDYPYEGPLRPIPNYPGRDNSLVDFAAELHRRIEAEKVHLADHAVRFTAQSHGTAGTTPEPSQPGARRSPKPDRDTNARRRRRRPPTSGRKPRRHR